MVFLIAKKNRAVVSAAATVTEWTIASADINLTLSRGKTSFKTPPSSDLGKNLQGLSHMSLPLSRERGTSQGRSGRQAGCHRAAHPSAQPTMPPSCRAEASLSPLLPSVRQAGCSHKTSRSSGTVQSHQQLFSLNSCFSSFLIYFFLKGNHIDRKDKEIEDVLH